MIKKLILKNFESHESSTFDFSPKVNFITGPSDKGKSSVRRALSWVVDNRPSGNDFVKDGEKETSVMLQIDRSRIVRELRKTKTGHTKDSKYRVNREVHEAIRSNVPEKVSVICNMTDVNIQSQFEPFFLLSSTPGNVAKAFNSIMGLDVVSDVLKNANSIVNKAKLNIEVANEEKGTIQQKLEMFPDLDSIEKVIKIIQATNDKIEQNQKSISKTERLIQQYEIAQKDLQKYKKLLFAKKQIINIQKLQDKKNILQQKVTSTNTNIRLFTKHQKNVKKFNALLKAKPCIDTVKKLIAKRKEIENKKEIIKKALWVYNKASKEIITTHTELNTAENDLKEFKTKHPHCPTCGKIWK